MESRLDVVRPFGGSRAAALIWIMPFWHTLGMTFVAAASAACRSDVQRLCSVIGGGRGVQQEHLAPHDVVTHVACGPHQRSSKILGSLARKDIFNRICKQRTHTCSNRRRGRQHRRPKHSPQTGRSRLSEIEPQSSGGIDVAVLEGTKAQPAMHLHSAENDRVPGVLPCSTTNFMWRLLIRRTPCGRPLTRSSLSSTEGSKPTERRGPRRPNVSDPILCQSSRGDTLISSTALFVYGVTQPFAVACEPSASIRSAKKSVSAQGEG